MTSNEIVKKAYQMVQEMIGEDLTVAEIILVLSMAKVLASETNTPQPTAAPATPVKTEKPLPTPETRIVAPVDSICFCDACRKVVYIVDKPVYDSMKVDDFIACFKPQGHSILLPKTAQLENIAGSLVTDCVLCKAPRSLWLVGPAQGKTTQARPKDSAAYEGVRPFGEGEF